MKLKINVPFTDKFTGEDYEVGNIIEVKEARGNELLADPRNLVESIDTPKTTQKKKATKKVASEEK